MRYRAERDGFVDSHYVCAGEEFEYDGAVPSWATPVGDAKNKTAAGSKRKPAAKPKTK